MPTRTLDEAVVSLDGWLSASERRELVRLARELGIDDAITHLHHGLGTRIRNGFLLWAPEGEELRNDVWESLTDGRREYYNNWWAQAGMACRGPYMHADDCSTEILRAYLQRLTEAK